MSHADDAGSGRHVRRRRAVSEKLEIVRLTMEPGASVAEIARAHGVNANQVFKWRRLFERGQLSDGTGRARCTSPKCNGGGGRVLFLRRGGHNAELGGR